MMKNRLGSAIFLLMFGCLTYAPLASAYVGPGLGVGAVASVLGVVSGLMMLVVGVVWYPLKKIFRYLKLKK